MMQGVTVPRY